MGDDRCGAVAFFIVAALLVGMAFGYGCTRDAYRQEAVDHGAAHWEVNEYGSTRFVWNDEEVMTDER